MRFREFLESTTGGWFDDKEDTRPTFSGRQQEMPGTSMHLGQDEVEGKVVARRVNKEGISLHVSTENGIKSIQMSDDHGHQDYRNGLIPKIGDTVRAVLNQDGTLQDYQVIHRANYVQQIINGAGAPTAAGLS